MDANKAAARGNTCVVIGGSGFLGRSFVGAAVKAGREVLVAGRRSRGEVKLSQGCDYIQGDCGDREFLRKNIKPGYDVVHLAYATVPKTSYDDPVFDLLSNVSPSVTLIQECVNIGVAKLLVISSGGTVYGDSADTPITEQDSTNPISPYGITKLTIEKYAQMFSGLSGVPITVARPSNAYGDGQTAASGQGFVAAAMRAALGGALLRVYGGAECIRDYIHVQDLAGGLLAVLDHGSGGECYNIGTGVGTSNKRVVEIIGSLAEKSGRSLIAEFGPKRVFDVEHSVLDCSKLRSLSGWRPRITFQAGVERLWYSHCEAGSLQTQDGI